MDSVLPRVYLLSMVGALFLGLGPVVSKRGLASGGTWVSNAVVVLTTRTTLLWIALLAVGDGPLFAGFTPVVAGLFLFGGVLASGSAASSSSSASTRSGPVSVTPSRTPGRCSRSFWPSSCSGRRSRSRWPSASSS